MKVGIDLGIHHAVATSDGKFFENPRFYKRELAKLKRLQRAATRKQKGSKNQQKAYRRVARLHERIANRRKDWAQKLTTSLCREYETIALEDLNVAGMQKNRRVSQAISDVSLAKIRRMLGYKSLWFQVNLQCCDRFAPTSKTCSSCGWKNENLTLSDRMFVCASCSLNLDRDTNAAINILKWAHRSDAHADSFPRMPDEVSSKADPTIQEASSSEQLGGKPKPKAEDAKMIRLVSTNWHRSLL
jgi:putative transposase